MATQPRLSSDQPQNRVLLRGTFSCTISNASGGQITMAMTSTATGNLEEGIYLYDLEITSGSGAVTRLMQGQVTVNPEITR